MHKILSLPTVQVGEPIDHYSRVDGMDEAEAKAFWWRLRLYDCLDLRF